MSGVDRPTGVTLHLVPEPVWRTQAGGETFFPEGFAAEGFVHTTQGEAMLLEVGNRYYRTDPRPYLVLDVDLDRVGADVRFDAAGPSFPHVYGPIETAAVIRVRRVERDEEGAFAALGPEEAGPTA